MTVKYLSHSFLHFLLLCVVLLKCILFYLSSWFCYLFSASNYFCSTTVGSLPLCLKGRCCLRINVSYVSLWFGFGTLSSSDRFTQTSMELILREVTRMLMFATCALFPQHNGYDQLSIIKKQNVKRTLCQTPETDRLLVNDVLLCKSN